MLWRIRNITPPLRFTSLWTRHRLLRFPILESSVHVLSIFPMPFLIIPNSPIQIFCLPIRTMTWVCRFLLNFCIVGLLAWSGRGVVLLDFLYGALLWILVHSLGLVWVPMTLLLVDSFSISLDIPVAVILVPFYWFDYPGVPLPRSSPHLCLLSLLLVLQGYDFLDLERLVGNMVSVRLHWTPCRSTMLPEL